MLKKFIPETYLSCLGLSVPTKMKWKKGKKHTRTITMKLIKSKNESMDKKKITAYSSLLDQGTQAAERVHQAILKAGPLNSLLSTDLPSYVGSAPDIQYGD